MGRTNRLRKHSKLMAADRASASICGSIIHPPAKDTLNMKHHFAIIRFQTSQHLSVWLRVPVLLAFLFATNLVAARLSDDLQRVPPGAMVDVIVQFTGAPSAADLEAIGRSGGSLKRRLPNIEGGLFTLPGAALQGISRNPHVLYVSPDRRLSGSLEFAEPTTGANIAFQYGWTGAGIGVAIIDSGIVASHPDLRQRVIYSENFVTGEDTTNDVYGHGTHVAGIVGGNGTASTGANYTYTFRGLAPSASLVNLRVLDRNGQGTDSSVIQALDRAVELKDAYGIRVVNVS